MLIFIAGSYFLMSYDKISNGQQVFVLVFDVLSRMIPNMVIDLFV